MKGNQPTLLEDITAIWEGEPEAAQATQVDQHGGRIEQRRLWVSQLLVGYSDWPHLAQVCRLERIVRTKGKRTQGQTRRESAYAVTSLPPDQANPQILLALWRGHWGIENRVHWVQGTSTFDEDRSQVRTGSAPQIMAALRNLTISALRLAGENQHRRRLASLRRSPITSPRLAWSCRQNNRKTLVAPGNRACAKSPRNRCPLILVSWKRRTRQTVSS